MVTGNKINSPPSGPTGRSGADAYPAQRLSKAEHVYHHLRDAILAGTLEPGTLIDKAHLCDELNVSRFPVTTAINRLAFERLVVIEPQHGSFVSKISAQDAREFLMIRRALEADIAAQAAVALPQDAREALARNIRYQHAAAEAEDSTGFYALDVDFHQTIVSGLRLTQSSDILKGLRAHAERVRRLLAPAAANETAEPPGRSDVRRLETELSEKLGAKVVVKSSPSGRGQLIVSFTTLDELDGILAHIR